MNLSENSILLFPFMVLVTSIKLFFNHLNIKNKRKRLLCLPLSSYYGNVSEYKKELPVPHIFFDAMMEYILFVNIQTCIVTAASLMQNDWFIMLNGRKGYYVSWKIFLFFHWLFSSRRFALLSEHCWSKYDLCLTKGIVLVWEYLFCISREAILRTNIAYLHLVIIFSASFPHEYYQRT